MTMTTPTTTPNVQSETAIVQTTEALYESWRTSEKYLIGAVLSAGITQKGSRAFTEAVDGTGIQFTDFFSRELAAVWYVMERLYVNNQDIDISTVWAELQKSDKARQYLTLDMIMYLSSVGKAGAHRTHAANVVDASISASISNALDKLKPLVDDPKINAAEKLHEVHKIVTGLSKRVEHATKSQTTGLVEGLQNYLKEYHAEAETGQIDVGIPTGFPQLDAKLDGWKKRTLNVIAGAPGRAGRPTSGNVPGKRGSPAGRAGTCRARSPAATAALARVPARPEPQDGGAWPCRLTLPR